MVTSALWSDVDADGWSDLLVTHEWGPVKIFINQKGKLIDATAASGIANLSGWWNSIAAADIDADGDIDYAVGNVGLNTKYHASADHPVLLFYGDLDGKGRPHIVEAEFEGSICYPVRGRSCSSHAMPGLKEKFPTYKAFASASLRDIYDEKRLESAKKLSANTLESGILLNVTKAGGAPQFQFRPLPRLAQISPVFGLAFAYADGDAYPELYLVQNFFGPQRETGRMNGGVSVLLKNQAGQRFAAIWPDKSGLVVPGDATSLTVSDFNEDGLADFHVGLNDDAPVAFQATQWQTAFSSFICIQLRGRAGNPDATGATVTLTGADGKSRTQQVSSGGGYLSQSSPRLFFSTGRLDSDKIESIQVVWPGGRKITYQIENLEQVGGRFWINE